MRTEKEEIERESGEIRDRLDAIINHADDLQIDRDAWKIKAEEWESQFDDATKEIGNLQKQLDEANDTISSLEKQIDEISQNS